MTARVPPQTLSNLSMDQGKTCLIEKWGHCTKLVFPLSVPNLEWTSYPKIDQRRLTSVAKFRLLGQTAGLKSLVNLFLDSQEMRQSFEVFYLYFAASKARLSDGK